MSTGNTHSVRRHKCHMKLKSQPKPAKACQQERTKQRTKQTDKQRSVVCDEDDPLDTSALLAMLSGLVRRTPGSHAHHSSWQSGEQVVLMSRRWGFFFFFFLFVFVGACRAASSYRAARFVLGRRVFLNIILGSRAHYCVQSQRPAGHPCSYIMQAWYSPP